MEQTRIEETETETRVLDMQLTQEIFSNFNIEKIAWKSITLKNEESFLLLARDEDRVHLYEAGELIAKFGDQPEDQLYLPSPLSAVYYPKTNSYFLLHDFCITQIKAKKKPEPKLFLRLFLDDQLTASDQGDSCSRISLLNNKNRRLLVFFRSRFIVVNIWLKRKEAVIRVERGDLTTRFTGFPLGDSGTKVCLYSERGVRVLDIKGVTRGPEYQMILHFRKRPFSAEKIESVTPGPKGEFILVSIGRHRSYGNGSHSGRSRFMLLQLTQKYLRLSCRANLGSLSRFYSDEKVLVSSLGYFGNRLKFVVYAKVKDFGAGVAALLDYNTEKELLTQKYHERLKDCELAYSGAHKHNNSIYFVGDGKFFKINFS